MRAEHLSANGVRLYVEVTGPESAVPVLLISGTGNDLRADAHPDGTKPPHPLVKSGFRLTQFDQRGLGQSDKPDLPYTMTDYADDAAALIDALGINRCHVVGISFGGMVAQHLAIRYPHVVDRLVLCCTSSGGPGGDSFDLLGIASLPEDERVKIAASVMDTRNDLSVSPPVFAPNYLPMAKRSARARTLMLADPNGPMGARRQLEARADHNTWADLPRVTAPTLVCGGIFDAQAPPQNIRTLSERIPNALLRMFDGGHAFTFQDPTAWPAIAAFLAN
jgi:3-oxoadipate enol-lactonase